MLNASLRIMNQPTYHFTIIFRDRKPKKTLHNKRKQSLNCCNWISRPIFRCLYRLKSSLNSFPFLTVHILSTYSLITADILEFNGQNNENNQPMTYYHDIHESRHCRCRISSRHLCTKTGHKMPLQYMNSFICWQHSVSLIISACIVLYRQYSIRSIFCQISYQL